MSLFYSLSLSLLDRTCTIQIGGKNNLHFVSQFFFNLNGFLECSVAHFFNFEEK